MKYYNSIIIYKTMMKIIYILFGLLITTKTFAEDPFGLDKVEQSSFNHGNNDLLTSVD